MSPASRNSAPASAPRRRGEASPSATRGPLQGNRGPPAVLSHPGCVRSVPTSPYPSRERCQLPDLAPLELPRLRGEVCRALFVSLRGLGGPPSPPDTSRAWLRLSGPQPEPWSSGTWLGEWTHPPPRASPASPLLRQPRRQPRVPPEPLGSGGSGFLSLKQCCCVTHMRFPAMLCNGKMAEERERKKKRANEQGGQSRSAAEPGGAGTAGWRRADWRREPGGTTHRPPSRGHRQRDAGGPGPLGEPRPQPNLPIPPFCLFRGGFWGSSSSRNPSGSKRLA